MKLELKLSTRSELSRSILEGSGPHMPRETRDRTSKLDSLTRVVKKASMEKEAERVLRQSGEHGRSPTMVSSFIWLFEQVIVRLGDRGR